MSTKKPRVSITERGQQTAALLDSDPRYRRGIESPFGLASEQIRLKEPGWYVRWVNAAIINDKVWRAKNVGYDNVRPDDLADQEQLGMVKVNEAGHIVRGERGAEVLMKIPAPVYHERQLAKTRKNLADMRDYDKEKQRMVTAAAAKFGSEAADYLNQQVGPIGNVRDTYERIEVNEDEQ